MKIGSNETGCRGHNYMNTKRLNVELGEEIFLKMKAIAALKNLTLKQCITRLIVEKIKKEESLLIVPKMKGGK